MKFHDAIWQATSKNSAKMRATRAARLFFLIQPIRSLLKLLNERKCFGASNTFFPNTPARCSCKRHLFDFCTCQSNSHGNSNHGVISVHYLLFQIRCCLSLCVFEKDWYPVRRQCWRHAAKGIIINESNSFHLILGPFTVIR